MATSFGQKMLSYFSAARMSALAGLAGFGALTAPASASTVHSSAAARATTTTAPNRLAPVAESTKAMWGTDLSASNAATAKFHFTFDHHALDALGRTANLNGHIVRIDGINEEGLSKLPHANLAVARSTVGHFQKIATDQHGRILGATPLSDAAAAAELASVKPHMTLKPEHIRFNSGAASLAQALGGKNGSDSYTWHNLKQHLAVELLPSKTTGNLQAFVSDAKGSTAIGSFDSKGNLTHVYCPKDRHFTIREKLSFFVAIVTSVRNSAPLFFGGLPGEVIVVGNEASNNTIIDGVPVKDLIASSSAPATTAPLATAPAIPPASVVTTKTPAHPSVKAPAKKSSAPVAPHSTTVVRGGTAGSDKHCATTACCPEEIAALQANTAAINQDRIAREAETAALNKNTDAQIKNIEAETALMALLQKTLSAKHADILAPKLTLPQTNTMPSERADIGHLPSSNQVPVTFASAPSSFDLRAANRNEKPNQPSDATFVATVDRRSATTSAQTSYVTLVMSEGSLLAVKTATSSPVGETVSHRYTYEAPRYDTTAPTSTAVPTTVTNIDYKKAWSAARKELLAVRRNGSDELAPTRLSNALTTLESTLPTLAAQNADEAFKVARYLLNKDRHAATPYSVANRVAIIDMMRAGLAEMSNPNLLAQAAKFIARLDKAEASRARLTRASRPSSATLAA